jgi:hypothetical protein
MVTANLKAPRELADWLKSDRVERLTSGGNWPTSETEEIWRAFRASYAPASHRIWKKTTVTVDAIWNDGLSVPAGFALRLADDANHRCTNLLLPDLQLRGALRRRLNPQRCGSTLATAGPDHGHVELTYLGPDELFAA